ncbi:hypothetical protein FOG18_13900 (plasmid) [Legionella israelensis]|uniref:hypothetical protein n=1 Tax=Legionella israelensis TaxID=454 RepID=UPI00117F74C6|nr:hypothetical protein [Legionella israelensis]QDP73746.1 hypothetical protein FOG18_13900 [Legionella israelensis]
MKYQKLIEWIEALEESNPNNERLKIYVGDIKTTLQKNFDDFTMNKVESFLSSLIKLDTSAISSDELERINYPAATAGMLLENFRNPHNIQEFRESYPSFSKEKEVIAELEESEEEEKRPVALLDVDHTLLFDNEFNETLLKSLKKNGIRDIYLFTDMRFGRLNVKDRMDLVESLQEKGFTVHGVITPVDLVWNQLSAENAEEFEKWISTSGFKGRFQGPAFEQLITDEENIERMPFLKKVNTYNPSQNTPGASYQEAVRAYRSIPESAREDEPLPGNMLTRSSYAKVFSDHLAEQLGYASLEKHTGHTKGLLLDFFLHHKPDWVSSIIIADDNKGVIEAVEEYKEKQAPEIPITTIEVTSHDMDAKFYGQRIKSHLEKDPDFSMSENKTLNEEFTQDIAAIKHQIDDQIKKLKRSKYNLFLSSPEAKIEALKLLKEFLDNPNEKAPEATTIDELVTEWKNSPSFKNSKTEERVQTTEVLTQHRNLFFNEHRSKPTSTEGFVTGLLNKYGDVELYEQSSKHHLK